MKLSRRNLFQAAFGAAQVGLLARYGLPTAMAQSASGRPTKMLAIWLVGGLHWESFFAPMTRAGIQKFIPPAQGGRYAYGYNPEQVEHLDRSPVDLLSPGPTRKLRVPVYWNWANPADRSGNNPNVGNAQVYRPEGYVWANPAYKLYEKAVLLVGADQETAAHASGLIASMSGVAGSTFRAPAVQAVVANAMASRFPDRPLPNVALGGPLPMALGLPALANPTPEQNERMLTIFDMLISLFERAFLVAYKTEMTPTEQRRWNSWDDSIREWCRRDDFHNALPALLRGEDPEFTAYVRRVAAEERGTPVLVPA